MANRLRATGAKQPQPAEAARRGFFKRALAAVIGALVIAVPGGAAVITALDPLLRGRKADAGFVPIAPLDAVPADGVPRWFQVIADRTDAWNKFQNEPLGAVYLTRTADKPDEVIAMNALCPHLGCFVSYQASRDGFFCPCHRSVFQTDGDVVNPSPAERALDRLETKIETAGPDGDEGEQSQRILVKFQNFRTGGKEKIPK